MSNIDFRYYGENIATYSKDIEFLQLRNVEEMCLIMKNARLSISEFNDVFGRFKRYFNPKELFEILRNTSINIGSSISDSLSLINSISSILDTRIFSDIGNSIRSYMNTTEKALSEPKLISSLKKCSKTDNLENLNRIYKILSIAAEERDDETIKYAIRNGYTDVKGDILNHYVESDWILLRSNALIKAASVGDLVLVKALERNGCNMRYRTFDGESFLHAFCLSDNVEGVKYALNFFDVNDVTRANETPFFCAVWAMQLQVVLYLITRPDLNRPIRADQGTVVDVAYYRAKQLEHLSEVLGREGFK